MSKWDKPKEVDNASVIFGINNISNYLPAWEEIPEDFKNERGEGKKWTSKVDDWFFSGITALKMTMKEGVDSNLALRHLKCIIGSFEPKHEHKTAGVAYLMSLWFEKFDYQKVKK